MTLTIKGCKFANGDPIPADIYITVKGVDVSCRGPIARFGLRK